jgi:hypothetical protein
MSIGCLRAGSVCATTLSDDKALLNGFLFQTLIMAHPPSRESDLTLADFLEQSRQSKVCMSHQALVIYSRSA